MLLVFYVLYWSVVLAPFAPGLKHGFTVVTVGAPWPNLGALPFQDVFVVYLELTRIVERQFELIRICLSVIEEWKLNFLFILERNVSCN